jgi:hypothetical protein
MTVYLINWDISPFSAAKVSKNQIQGVCTTQRLCEKQVIL